MRRRKNSWYPQPLPQPKRVSLVLKYDAMMADITNLCGIIGEAHDAVLPDGAKSQTTLTKDVAENGNRDLIARIVDKTMKEAMMLLFPYTKTPLDIRFLDNDMRDVEAYIIELTFDYERSDVQVMYLQSQIHDYVVKKCMYDWLSYSMVPGQRVSDVTLHQRKFLEESEFAKGNILTALAEPMEIRNHHVKPSFF